MGSQKRAWISPKGEIWFLEKTEYHHKYLPTGVSDINQALSKGWIRISNGGIDIYRLDDNTTKILNRFLTYYLNKYRRPQIALYVHSINTVYYIWWDIFRDVGFDIKKLFYIH